jgi:hypothetical protein
LRGASSVPPTVVGDLASESFSEGGFVSPSTKSSSRATRGPASRPCSDISEDVEGVAGLSGIWPMSSSPDMLACVGFAASTGPHKSCTGNWISKLPSLLRAAAAGQVNRLSMLCQGQAKTFHHLVGFAAAAGILHQLLMYCIVASRRVVAAGRHPTKQHQDKLS